MYHDMALGVTVTSSASSDLVRGEDAYGSLLQLVIFCKCDSKLEAYEWELLNIALSNVTHPLAVDIVSEEDFAEDAEARLQARIPSAIVHLHTIVPDEDQEHSEDVVKEFWEQTDGAGVTAGPTGS